MISGHLGEGRGKPKEAGPFVLHEVNMAEKVGETLAIDGGIEAAAEKVIIHVCNADNVNTLARGQEHVSVR